jgi:hypothetical protein
VGLLDRPDFERLRRDKDFPRLIHWAIYDKDPDSSRAALAALRQDVYAVVEYLYETAASAQANSVGRRKRLPTRSVSRLHEAVRGLTKIGAPAVRPLVDSVLVYGQYGDPDENARFLYLALVYDVLEKIGRPAVAGLRELAESRDKDLSRPAREALLKLDSRGLLDDE